MISWCAISVTANNFQCDFRLFVNTIYGGMKMNAADYWSIFMETGAPEAYIAYTRALKMEENHVFDDAGFGSSGHGLQ